ncbi:MAG: sugar ABC transporter substrate-binding protein [Candidatus Atribacteria bacterium]|nr:sugar ABC transporter substrate-binding protein [Candidatus Atribacteria bacterium]
MRKKSIIFFSVLVIVFLIVAGVHAETGKKLVIGQVFWGLHDSYQQAHQVAAKAYCESLGIEYIPMDGQMKPEVQAAAMEDLVARQVDGIICQAYDQAAMEVSIDAAQKAGIPVVSFVNVSSGQVKYPTMLIDEKQGAIAMGELAAKKIMEYFPGKKIKVATISDPSIEWAHVQRTKAFIEGIQKVAPDAEWVFNGGKSNREVAYSTAEDILQSFPDVNIMFGYDAENVLGSLAAFEAAGRGNARDKVPVSEIFVGVDGSVPELVKIANPKSAMKLTLALQPQSNARKCIDMLLKIINKEMDMYATDKNEAVVSFIVNGWDMSKEDIEKFVKDQWAIKVDLAKEIGQ